MDNRNKIDVLSRLSDEMKAVLKYQEEHSGEAFNTAGLSYPEIRANYVKERRFWNEGGPRMAKSVDVDVPCETRKIRTRVHYPNETPGNAVIFYLHGGGFTVGSIDTHDRIMRNLAHHSDCVVIGVDYSLSPEAKFPAAILESVEVTDYFRAHAAQYGIDAGRVGYAGDSGGASLSAGAALWQRDNRKDISFIRALLLYYGMFGLRDSRSRRIYGGAWDGLTEEDFKFYDIMYLEKSEDGNSPYVCFFNNDLTRGVPPCFIAACEFDPLIDDSIAFYDVIREHGCVCEYKMYPGTLHAFLHYSRMMQASADAIIDGARFFQKHIGKEA